MDCKQALLRPTCAKQHPSGVMLPCSSRAVQTLRNSARPKTVPAIQTPPTQQRQQGIIARTVSSEASGRQVGQAAPQGLLQSGRRQEELYGANSSPANFWGPVQDITIPGKGRGLVTTRDVAPGELVLVCPPIAYVAGSEEGEVPEAEALYAEVRQTPLNRAQRQALHALYGGDDERPLPSMPDLQELEAAAAALEPLAQAAQAVSEGIRCVGEDELDEYDLYGIIGCNCFGEPFHDFPSTVSREAGAAAGSGGGGASISGSGSGGLCDTQDMDCVALPSLPPPAHPHLGLWPHFSLLNHSCLPNAVDFVVDRSMVVTATRHIPQGGEVMINYIGGDSLQPVEQRQASLAAGYQFSCACDRCSGELLAGDHLNGIMQEVAGRCSERAEAVALASGQQQPQPLQPPPSAAERASLATEIRQDVLRIEFAVRTATMDPERQQWLYASAFPLFSQAAAMAVAEAEATSTAAAAVAAAPSAAVAYEADASADGGDTAAAAAAAASAVAANALRRQLGICKSVCPGSDLHMYLAVKLLSLEQRMHGPASHQGAAALGTCMRVLQLRYGGVAPPTLERLLHGAALGLMRVAV